MELKTQVDSAEAETSLKTNHGKFIHITVANRKGWDSEDCCKCCSIVSVGCLLLWQLFFLPITQNEIFVMYFFAVLFSIHSNVSDCVTHSTRICNCKQTEMSDQNSTKKFFVNKTRNGRTANYLLYIELTRHTVQDFWLRCVRYYHPDGLLLLLLFLIWFSEWIFIAFAERTEWLRNYYFANETRRIAGSACAHMPHKPHTHTPYFASPKFTTSND